MQSAAKSIQNNGEQGSPARIPTLEEKRLAEITVETDQILHPVIQNPQDIKHRTAHTVNSLRLIAEPDPIAVRTCFSQYTTWMTAAFACHPEPSENSVLCGTLLPHLSIHMRLLVYPGITASAARMEHNRPSSRSLGQVPLTQRRHLAWEEGRLTFYGKGFAQRGLNFESRRKGRFGNSNPAGTVPPAEGRLPKKGESRGRAGGLISSRYRHNVMESRTSQLRKR